MLVFLFFCFSQENKRICLCNNECSALCPAIVYNTNSVEPRFIDFINSQIKDETDIDLDFYSKHDNFSFLIDTSNFGDRKVTIRALKDSKEIILKIRDKNHSKVMIKPNQKIVLPSLIPIPEQKHKNLRAILPSSSNIPISVALHQMQHVGDATCQNKDNKLKNKKLDQIGSGDNSNCRCPTDKLDQSNAYRCGIRCWGHANYSYTFKGVQFALYGTIDVKDLGKFYVVVDNGPEDEVNEYSSSRQEFAHIYTSNILEYKEHTVKIFTKGDQYELFKLAYWPTLDAKRLNCTDFSTSPESWTNKWKTETDGIGGIRKYKADGSAIIKFECTRFWIYGLKDNNYPDLHIYYNGKSETVSTHSNPRQQNVLLFESPEFEYSPITVNLKPSSGDLIIYCIYYEISSAKAPIPISVSLKEMNAQNYDQCSNKNNDKNVNFDSGFYSCPTSNFDTENAYECGIRCWGTKMSYSYTFKGVRFGLFGKYEPDFGTVNVY